MEWRAITLAAIVASIYAFWSGTATSGFDWPWRTNGEHTDWYEGFVDQTTTWSGNGSKSLRYIGPPDAIEAPDTYITVLQRFSAMPYWGKRIRFSAMVKIHEVPGEAAIWLRADAVNGYTVAYDNSSTEPHADHGSHDWQRKLIVLDVPQAAAVISLGFDLAGRGQAWMDDAQFEIVDQTIATTAAPFTHPKLHLHPEM